MGRAVKRTFAVVFESSVVALLTLFYVLSMSGCENTAPPEAEPSAKERLGKLLFFDENLSTPPGQACADCHSPDAGFADPNPSLPVSQGVHPDRFGNRNDLAAAYAGFSPAFQYDPEEKIYFGGQFWDGRASTLAEQAKGPFLNPLEMANPDAEAVVQKVQKSDYADLFKEVYGATSFDNTEQAYDFIADAIATYEQSEELNKFNSKYDLYLAGQVELNDQEKRGLHLFEDEEKGNCAACHPTTPGPYSKHPLLTDYTYDNLGIPKNPANPFYYMTSSLNPDGREFVDLGLGGELGKQEEEGKFKVPSLRNVAETSPYMHNGIFDNLNQVLLFYSSRDIGPWPPPETPINVNQEELGNLGLTMQEIDDIVAFLHTLTDDYKNR